MCIILVLDTSSVITLLTLFCYGLDIGTLTECYVFCRQLTCRWAYTTDPNSFHVPPRRSIRTIRNIWKNRRPLKAEAATIWPSDVSTIVEAITVITSENRSKFKDQKATNRRKNMHVRTYYAKRTFHETKPPYPPLISGATSWWPQPYEKFNTEPNDYQHF